MSVTTAVERTVLLAIFVALAACRDAPLPQRVRPRLETLLRSEPALRDLYAKHGYRLLWSDETGKILPGTRSLLEALEHAREHGLDPEDYQFGRLEALGREIDERTIRKLADFDLLASAAFFRYATDLSTGRVHPDQVRSDWHTNPPEIDFAPALEQALDRGDLAALLESLPPPHPGYARLREALGKLREVEAAGGWPAIPEGPKLGPGVHGSRVALLRQRLREPFSASVPGTALEERFDASLADSVRRFQALHGIDPDGVVGDRTLRELNVPVADRIHQVELNLERWRWIPRGLGNPHVLVNIPGFDLELARNGASAWRTRVVAGKAYTPTPVFSDRIVAIVVNPPWNVPESIAVSEYLPELRKDRNALAHRGLRVLQGSGEKEREVNPRSVDWAHVDGEHFPYHLRQDPGKENPLGRIKFDLTNDFHVYLHDTPAEQAFGRSERDLSHGCIRVQNALELANEIAGEASAEKLRQALEQPDEQRIQLEAKVPVHILYWTAWADAGGALHFGPDIYGFDGPQQAALEGTAPALGQPPTNAALLPAPGR